jgi:hypothetical protein
VPGDGHRGIGQSGIGLSAISLRLRVPAPSASLRSQPLTAYRQTLKLLILHISLTQNTLSHLTTAKNHKNTFWAALGVEKRPK